MAEENTNQEFAPVESPAVAKDIESGVIIEEKA